MGKLILYIIIAILIYWLIKNRKQKHAKNETPIDPIEDMVSCKHCGIHLPKSEAIYDSNQYFCCKEHCIQHTNSSS
ncbi:MAG: hypothetical protein DYH15_06670 [Nitrosomonas sp. PRO4]|nr:hypothetical protein [Nitrosomonas sp. PRO4]